MLAQLAGDVSEQAEDSMEDGPTRTHTLHTIGSRADTRHTVTGRSTGSGLLDTQHTAHRTAHEVALYSGVLRDRHRRRRCGADCTLKATRSHTTCRVALPGAQPTAEARQAPGSRPSLA